MNERDTLGTVERYLLDLQARLCQALQSEDGTGTFGEDRWDRETGGGGLTRILEGGAVFERAGVAWSGVSGAALPPSAIQSRPELAGRAWRATGLSMVVHPANPFVPAMHANLRFFTSDGDGSSDDWWFGGGFDLTPTYGFEDDARHWHQQARAACDGFGEGTYSRLKRWCDEYFFLPHRGETRGVGGLFFDDWRAGGFERSLAFLESVGEHILSAYLPIVRRRRDTPYGERERAFQCLRRGRYVEFNLVQDRGTLFGLQSGGRTESILMSMPPEVSWRYDWRPEAGSPEAQLVGRFLTPREWLEVDA